MFWVIIDIKSKIQHPEKVEFRSHEIWPHDYFPKGMDLFLKNFKINTVCK